MFLESSLHGWGIVQDLSGKALPFQTSSNPNPRRSHHVFLAH